jgi:hypothetical protein
MKIGRANSEAGTTRVIVVTADTGFEELVRATFGASEQIALSVVAGSIAAVDGDLDDQSATVAVVDLVGSQVDEMRALERLMARVGRGCRSSSSPRRSTPTWRGRWCRCASPIFW